MTSPGMMDVWRKANLLRNSVVINECAVPWKVENGETKKNYEEI